MLVSSRYRPLVNFFYTYNAAAFYAYDNAYFYPMIDPVVPTVLTTSLGSNTLGIVEIQSCIA